MDDFDGIQIQAEVYLINFVALQYTWLMLNNK
jgi:hypothetical protein